MNNVTKDSESKFKKLKDEPICKYCFSIKIILNITHNAEWGTSKRVFENGIKGYVSLCLDCGKFTLLEIANEN